MFRTVRLIDVGNVHADIHDTHIGVQDDNGHCELQSVTEVVLYSSKMGLKWTFEVKIDFLVDKNIFSYHQFYIFEMQIR